MFFLFWLHSGVDFNFRNTSPHATEGCSVYPRFWRGAVASIPKPAWYVRLGGTGATQPLLQDPRIVLKRLFLLKLTQILHFSSPKNLMLNIT